MQLNPVGEKHEGYVKAVSLLVYGDEYGAPSMPFCTVPISGFHPICPSD